MLGFLRFQLRRGIYIVHYICIFVFHKIYFSCWDFSDFNCGEGQYRSKYHIWIDYFLSIFWYQHYFVSIIFASLFFIQIYSLLWKLGFLRFRLRRSEWCEYLEIKIDLNIFDTNITLYHICIFVFHRNIFLLRELWFLRPDQSVVNIWKLRYFV